MLGVPMAIILILHSLLSLEMQHDFSKQERTSAVLQCCFVGFISLPSVRLPELRLAEDSQRSPRLKY